VVWYGVVQCTFAHMRRSTPGNDEPHTRCNQLGDQGGREVYSVTLLYYPVVLYYRYIRGISYIALTSLPSHSCRITVISSLLATLEVVSTRRERSSRFHGQGHNIFHYSGSWLLRFQGEEEEVGQGSRFSDSPPSGSLAFNTWTLDQINYEMNKNSIRAKVLYLNATQIR